MKHERVWLKRLIERGKTNFKNISEVSMYTKKAFGVRYVCIRHSAYSEYLRLTQESGEPEKA